VILSVDSDIDKVSTPAKIQLIKTIQEDEGPDTSFIAVLLANIVFLIAGLVAIVFVSIITLRVIKDARAPIEEYSSIEDYSTSFANIGIDTNLPSAPELPSSDEVANSMYGGTQEIFENPAADMPPPPLPESEESNSEETIESSDIGNDQTILPPGVPPIPEEGLPEGWTVDQWAYYGQKWLDENKDN